MQIDFRIRRLITGMVALTALVLLAGCSDNKTAADTTSTGGTAAPKGPVKIAFLVKQPEEAWFQLEWKFAAEAAKKDGFDLITIGVPDGDQVISKISNVAAQGAQGLVICTPDVKLGPAIVAKAKELNLKLLTVDDQLVGSDGKFLDVPHVGISARKIGNTVGDSLFTEMRKRGWKPEETAMLVITFDQLDTARERTEGAIEAIIKDGFPKDKIYRSGEKTSDVPGSHDAASPVLAQHTEVKNWLIASMNDTGVMGAVRASETLQIPADHVIAIGINGDSALEDLKKPNPTGVFGSILLQAKVHGYDTSDMMYKWITEGKEPKKITYTDGILITRDNYKQVLTSQGLTP
jgi:L-arabinose transport system substrate-binding protein